MTVRVRPRPRPVGSARARRRLGLPIGARLGLEPGELEADVALERNLFRKEKIVACKRGLVG